MIQYKHNGRILEGKKDTLLSTAESQNKWEIKSEMAWGKTSGQRWLYFGTSEKSPLRRFLSWLCKGTSIGYGKENREIFVANGSSAPQKWGQTRQPNFKSAPTPKSISTFKSRKETWNI